MLGVVLLVSPAAAQPDAPKEADEAARRCPCGGIGASALDRIADRIGAGLGRVPAGATVVSVPLDSDEPAPEADALANLVARQVAGRLGADVSFVAGPTTDPLDDAEPPGVVVLRPAIARGKLRVSADGHSVPTTVWGRARAASQRGPVVHAHATAPIDAEVRAHLAPVGLGDAPTVSRFEDADPAIEAVACGDLDGDAETDVVTMTRSRVLRVALRDGSVERLAAARWDDLAPIAPVPLRDPLGFATIGDGTLDVSITDRHGSLRLGPDLAAVAEMDGIAVPHGRGTACTAVAGLRLAARLEPCTEGAHAPAVPTLRAPSDAMDSTVVVGEEGAARVVVAWREDGTVALGDGEDHVYVARAGAQLAVADLDQDGAAEVASSLDNRAPEPDAVELRTLLPSGTVERHGRVRVPAGVEAIAACPPDRAGEPAPVLVATDGELWVLRW